MATIRPLYGPPQNITITLADLPNGGARESDDIDHFYDPVLDVLVQLSITLAAGTPGSDKKVYVYAAGSIDGGVTWPDNVTGSNAAITLDSPTQLRLIGVIEAPTSAGSFVSEPMSVAQAFGGIMPQRWSLVVQNKTNIAFSAYEEFFVKKYQTVRAETV